jgi:phenylalanyl-tRNA synthetase alpha subunit
MKVNNINQLQKMALAELASLSSAEDLQVWHNTYLGRKRGQLTELMKSLKDMSAQAKREVGPLANKAKVALTVAYEAKEVALAGGASGKIDTFAFSYTNHRRNYRHF